MDDILAADEAGNVLTAFRPGGEEEDRFDDGPMPLALAAVWHGRRLMMVLNRLRRCWELPGGLIDPGETPREAARRELREETGLDLATLAFAGHARFVLGPERRVEYAALYTGRYPGTDTGHTTACPWFTPNEEISAICWWDGIRPLSPRIQPIDAHLGFLTRRA